MKTLQNWLVIMLYCDIMPHPNFSAKIHQLSPTLPQFSAKRDSISPIRTPAYPT